MITDIMYANKKVESKNADLTLLLSRRAKSLSQRSTLWFATIEIIIENERVGFAICSDLSSVGAYIRSDYLFCVGEQFNIRLYLASRIKPMEILGEVIRVETGETGMAPGMGIAFRRISKQDSDELKQFLLRRFLTHV